MHELLNAIPQLREAGPAVVDDIAEVAEYFSLPGGWRLFAEGDPAQGLYFVLAGALVVLRAAADGTDDVIGYVRAGEPVGEMALIAGNSHSASVFALRDTEVVKIPRDDYERLWRKHPALLHCLARSVLDRARASKPDLARAQARVFTLVATSPSIDIEARARDLQARLRRIGIDSIALGEDAAEKPTAFFEEMERRHQVVLLPTRIGDTSWFRLALRQADRIWVFARRDGRPSNPMPLMPDENSSARRFRLVDLVLLNEGSTQAAEPREWVEAVDAARLFRWNDDHDADRLARLMGGRSIGLVFSGGGARAYAHIGAVRAIREAGLPIDLVGGTSMGAIIAACVAMGWCDDEIERRIRDAFVSSNPLGDHTLPVIALTRGRRVEERLTKHFDGVLIEDLRVPFFCVATDLASGRPHIARFGPLVRALRASISLPGMLPPVVQDGAVLVDGAILANFPTDVMRLMHRGSTIGIDVARQSGFSVSDYMDPPGFFGWVRRHGFRSAPPIVSILMRSATLGIDLAAGHNSVDLLIAPEIKGVELRDWKAYDVAVAAGYEATKAALTSSGITA